MDFRLFFPLFFFLSLEMNDVFWAGFWLDSCLFVLVDLLFSGGRMQGYPFSEVFWMGLLTHKLGVSGRFWKRFRGIFICVFGKQECGEGFDWENGVGKRPCVLSETPLRLDWNASAFGGKLFDV